MLDKKMLRLLDHFIGVLNDIHLARYTRPLFKLYDHNVLLLIMLVISASKINPFRRTRYDIFGAIPASIGIFGITNNSK